MNNKRSWFNLSEPIPVTRHDFVLPVTTGFDTFTLQINPVRKLPTCPWGLIPYDSGWVCEIPAGHLRKGISYYRRIFHSVLEGR